VVKIEPAPQPIDLETSQELQPFATESKQSELIEEPFQLTMPDKSQSISQPISPLIVRPHKASQGSPIAPNLPALQIDTEPKDEQIFNWRIEAKPEQHAISAQNISTDDSTDSPLSPNSAVVTNSTKVSTVAAPRFMQALYGVPNVVNAEKNEDPQLAISDSKHRKAVTSLAAVQLPQFPPLPRR
jgi:hypothetical protein